MKLKFMKMENNMPMTDKEVRGLLENEPFLADFISSLCENQNDGTIMDFAEFVVPDLGVIIRVVHENEPDDKKAAVSEQKPEESKTKNPADLDKIPNTKVDVPKDGEVVLKADGQKPRLDLVPLEGLVPMAKVREFAVGKYGPKGIEAWREISDERLLAALLRHLVAFQMNPEAVDEESGLPAIYHVEANAMFLAIKAYEKIANAAKQANPTLKDVLR